MIKAILLSTVEVALYVMLAVVVALGLYLAWVLTAVVGCWSFELSECFDFQRSATLARVVSFLAGVGAAITVAVS
jgi:hypothetical protein